jgi:hypothetical protein
MARDHARIQVGIWNDPDFRALDRDDQRMYLLLCSQPRLTYCGTLDYFPSRLAKLSADDTEENVLNAIWRLEKYRFIVIDEETHEVLCRTFVRHDGLLKSPNITRAMCKDRSIVISDKLRESIDVELRRAWKEDAGQMGWKGMAEGFPDLFRQITGKRSWNPSPKGSEKGGEK